MTTRIWLPYWNFQNSPSDENMPPYAWFCLITDLAPIVTRWNPNWYPQRVSIPLDKRMVEIVEILDGDVVVDVPESIRIQIQSRIDEKLTHRPHSCVLFTPGNLTQYPTGWVVGILSALRLPYLTSWTDSTMELDLTGADYLSIYNLIQVGILQLLDSLWRNGTVVIPSGNLESSRNLEPIEISGFISESDLTLEDTLEWKIERASSTIFRSRETISGIDLTPILRQENISPS